jgi:isoquinoline 1-oxidoreductase beta subunit
MHKEVQGETMNRRGLGFYIPYTNKLNGKTVASTIFEPNAWIKIKSDNIVQIMVGKSEMGQGVLTSLPMIIAEEMDLDWSKIIIEKAPADQKKYGSQMTGGSNSVSSGWKKLREAGAVAREMMVMAAAQEWGILSSECKTHNGIVTHESTGRELSYGDLAKKASLQKVPKNPKLKAKQDFWALFEDWLFLPDRHRIILSRCFRGLQFRYVFCIHWKGYPILGQRP